MDISVGEAASRLGLSAQTVRRMVDEGELAARRLGRAWAIDDADVAVAIGVPRPPGRPWSARSAWAVLAQFGDLDIGPMSRSEAARARHRAARPGSLAPGVLARRARLHRLRGPRGSLARVSQDDRVVLSGARVVRGIVAEDVVEGYVPGPDLAVLVDQFALTPSGADMAQILLRVPAIDWPFGDRPYAPEAVAAADLLDSNDSRSVDAGRAVLKAAAERRFAGESAAR